MEAASPGTDSSSLSSSPGLTVSSPALAYLVALSHIFSFVCTIISITRTTLFLFHLRHGSYANHFTAAASVSARRYLRYWVCYGFVSFSALLLQGYLGALGLGGVAVVLRGASVLLMTIGVFGGRGDLGVADFVYRKIGRIFDVYGRDLEGWFVHVGDVWKELEKESGEWAKRVLEWIAVGGFASLSGAGVESGTGTGKVVPGKRKRWRGQSSEGISGSNKLFGGNVREKIKVLREGLVNGGRGRVVPMDETPMPKSRHEVVREAREAMRRKGNGKKVEKGVVRAWNASGLENDEMQKGNG